MYFDIPEQSARNELRDVAQAANLALIFPQALVASKHKTHCEVTFQLKQVSRFACRERSVKTIDSNSTIYIGGTSCEDPIAS
tara:strand:+ start:8890 stop:9135 length:246 start_codon:yes stop_codon:yes gene_type:complete